MSPASRPGLIETMRTDRAGIRFLDRHLARLSASARELGLACPLDAVRSALTRAAWGLEAASRLRLHLEPDGCFEVTVGPLPPPAAGPQAIVIAAQRLDSSDPWLRHKTTCRQVFEAARAGISDYPGVVDAVLLNERDELCEGAIANIFLLLDGRLLTPAPGCGLLPGVMRGHVIEAYGAEQAVLQARDLQRAQRLFLSNSVRGMIEVSLVD